MPKTKERMRIILKHLDGRFTIKFTGGQVTQLIDLSQEELLDLAADLDVWRWRLTGDSYDPRVTAAIHEESGT